MKAQFFRVDQIPGDIKKTTQELLMLCHDGKLRLFIAYRRQGGTVFGIEIGGKKQSTAMQTGLPAGRQLKPGFYQLPWGDSIEAAVDLMQDAAYQLETQFLEDPLLKVAKSPLMPTWRNAMRVQFTC